MNENFVESLGITNDHPDRIGLIRIANGMAYLGVDQDTCTEVIERARKDQDYLCLAMLMVSNSILASVSTAERPGLFQEGGPFFVSEAQRAGGSE